MDNLLNILAPEQVILLSAPPGWGKTYKLLDALKKSKRKIVFVFPLRCLCEEVFKSASEMHINVCNIEKKMEFEAIRNENIQLIVTTPECLKLKYIEFLARDYLFILDEVHLYYYWGESFRPYMSQLLERVQTYAPALILLTATLNDEFKKDLQKNLQYNYKEIIHLDYGNQVLINRPGQISFYLFSQKDWILDEILFKKTEGVGLVFCLYREQVKTLALTLKEKGFKVLSCVGGEAKEFYADLIKTEGVEFIVATSVISHGVNLPRISSIYFMDKITNQDFYLQMLGRGGRDGSKYHLHTFNQHFLDKKEIGKGILRVFIKRIRNKVISFLYYVHER